MGVNPICFSSILQPTKRQAVNKAAATLKNPTGTPGGRLLLGNAGAFIFPCIPKFSVSERGVDAAALSLLPQLSLNSHLVGSFPLKRPEGRAPTN
jgi:hypothetical protein